MEEGGGERGVSLRVRPKPSFPSPASRSPWTCGVGCGPKAAWTLVPPLFECRSVIIEAEYDCVLTFGVSFGVSFDVSDVDDDDVDEYNLVVVVVVI